MRLAIERVAAQQHGAVSRAQILHLGLSASGIDSRVAAGRLRVVHPGVYVMPAAPSTWEQRLFTAWLASGAPASHEAAAVIWGLEGVDADEPHLIVPHSRKLRLRGVVVHRARSLERRDAVRRRGIPVTTPVRTLVDLAGSLAPDALEYALDDALRRRLVAVPGIEQRLERLDRVHGSGTLRALVRERSGIRVSESALETRFRRRLRKAGLPAPIAQYEVRDERRRLLARVDFAYPAQRLAIEVDGYASHSGRRRWESDLARQNRLLLAGWRFLRFTNRDVDGEGNFLAAIGAMLSHCGEHGRSDHASAFPTTDEGHR